MCGQFISHNGYQRVYAIKKTIMARRQQDLLPHRKTNEAQLKQRLSFVGYVWKSCRTAMLSAGDVAVAVPNTKYSESTLLYINPSTIPTSVEDFA